MIQRIELWDFESHEHTVLEDFSPALNLFLGDSNAGKTSVVRALKLAAYNEFDPKSVRVGAPKCVVQVDTERGRVKVTRGPKHNAWEITKIGQPTQYFDKVGTNIVPDAAEIIGLNIVRLGDVDVPVNIMDQLESHFLLKGVGDKDATGSMRAQIIDEISGLSGIEGLIKSVSLDHTRGVRGIGEEEAKMKGIQAQLHPEAGLNAEDVVLGQAENELTDHATMMALVVEGDDLVSRGSRVRQEVSLQSRRLSEIPDTGLAKTEMSRSGDLMDRALSSAILYREGVITVDHLAGIRKTLAGMPDLQVAATFVKQSDGAGKVLVQATDVNKRWDVANLSLGQKQARERDIITALVAVPEINKAQTAVMRGSGAVGLLDTSQRLMASIMGLRHRAADKDRDLQAAVTERDAILAAVKTCPLTLRPVSKECLEGATV